MTFLEALLPSGRIHSEQPVERAKGACGAQDGDETEERPPAQAVDAKKQHSAAGDKAQRSIIGADICFHG